MDEIILAVEQRPEIGRGKVNGLRRQGFIPGVVYSNGTESLPVKISRHELLGLIHRQRIENVVITLKVKDASKENRSCMIKEIQHDPVRGDIIHVDFNEISLTKKVKVNVPVVTKGEAVGVKQEGGSLEHVLWEVEIECLPTRIPKNFEVDVTVLKLGDSVHVRDLALPEGITMLSDADSVLVSVAAPMKEEVAAPAEGEEAKAEPEVIKEKKEEPAEGEGKEKEKEKEKK